MQLEIVWSWWKHFDGSLYEEEGLWVNTRMWIIQCTQLIVGGFLASFMYVVAVQGANAAEDLRTSLEDDNLADWIMEIFPTYNMVFYSLFPAAIAGTVVVGTICFLYLPR